MEPRGRPVRESRSRGVLAGTPSPTGRAPTVDRVDARDDIRAFLTSRRAKITPEQAGLPAFGRNRRVKGLRREEAAMLAGISVEYYTRLERGRPTGVSEEVLESIARGLQLDEAERAHLFDLVRAASTTTTTARRPTQERVRPTVRRVLDSISAPAYLRNGRLDILAANALGAALYSPVFESSTGGTPNMARFIFLSQRAVESFGRWDNMAND